VFVAIVIQALPFLTLGVLVSGAITALVSPAVLARLLPRSPMLAVPSAALAGTALPGCECASVPVAGRLCGRGVQPAPAVTFMLAAPAINPVVLVATAVAFPGQPQMVLARFLGSLGTSVVVGLLWSRVGGRDWVERARGRLAADDGPRWLAFTSAARHDLWDAGAGWWWARPRPPHFKYWSPARWWRPWPTSRCWPYSPWAGWRWCWPSARRRTRSWPPACGSSRSGPAGLSGRGPGGGRQADRHAGRAVRPPVRRPLRPADSAAVVCALAAAQVVLR
jgi:hypothetical protein